MATLLNKAEAKRRILALLAERRPSWPCSRISGDYYDHLEAKMMATIEYDVQRHGSIGHTFGPGVIA